MDEALIKRVLPHSVEAEQSVIGSMLMDREAIIAASEIITGADFYQHQYGVMFESMVELFNEGKPVDLVTLQNRLREKDVPPEVSSLDFVRDIMTSVPTSVNVKSYANIVREKAVLRRLIKVNEEIENLCYGGRDKLEDILAQDSSLKVDYAYECMRQVGFYEQHAEKLADKAVQYANENGVSMTEAVISTLGDTITYVGGLVLFFLLILILLIAIANIGNLSFRLPMHETADAVGGAVAGFIKGCLYCVLLCWLLGFLGLIIKDSLNGAALARLFLSIRFVTGGLL